MVRIDIFFKKKIITIYLHPGARGGKRRRGAGQFYLQGTQEGRGLEEGETWGGLRGWKVLMPPIPCLSSSSLPTAS